MKSLIVLHSYHHNNTRKVAETMAGVIGAAIKSPMDINGNELKEYGLIGFGSGIDSGKHYRELLDFADILSPVEGKRCFIFSTSAVQGDKKVSKDHARLREILQSKGYQVIGEFSCLGFNTNSFLKYFGGMNKDRPNDVDINNARKFASNLEI
jgi:flavodoxin